MPKQKFVFEIDVPEGWKAADYRVPGPGEYYYSEGNVEYTGASRGIFCERLILERKQPARMEIIFEEVPSKKIQKGLFFTDQDTICPKKWVLDQHDFSASSQTKVWRLVEKNT